MTPQTSPPGEDSITAYLDVLAGESPDSHFLELRYRVADDRLTHSFHRIDQRDELVREILRRGSRTDVYVGCAPRTTRRGSKDAIDAVWTLWAECDGQESVRRLHAFRPRPALVIASGSGPNCHAYWPLDQPLSPKVAEVFNLRIAHALGADLACFDASRILRPPATWNFKHDPPRPVGVLGLKRHVRFSPDHVLTNVPEVDASAVERRWQVERRGGRDDPLLQIPPAVYVEDLLGVRPGRNRKVACPFHVETHPSLHVYATGERGWCCFSCRRGGTIYDLAGGVWRLETRGAEFREIRRRLLERYGRELSAARAAADRDALR